MIVRSYNCQALRSGNSVGYNWLFASNLAQPNQEAVKKQVIIKYNTQTRKWKVSTAIFKNLLYNININ